MHPRGWRWHRRHRHAHSPHYQPREPQRVLRSQMPRQRGPLRARQLHRAFEPARGRSGLGIISYGKRRARSGDHASRQGAWILGRRGGLQEAKGVVHPVTSAGQEAPLSVGGVPALCSVLPIVHGSVRVHCSDVFSRTIDDTFRVELRHAVHMYLACQVACTAQRKI
jgi:hypothetical protein